MWSDGFELHFALLDHKFDSNPVPLPRKEEVHTFKPVHQLVIVS